MFEEMRHSSNVKMYYLYRKNIKGNIESVFTNQTVLEFLSLKHIVFNYLPESLVCLSIVIEIRRRIKAALCFSS